MRVRRRPHVFGHAQNLKKAEYGTNKYSCSPGTLVLATRWTFLHFWSGSIRMVQRTRLFMVERSMKVFSTLTSNDVAR